MKNLNSIQNLNSCWYRVVHRKIFSFFIFCWLLEISTIIKKLNLITKIQFFLIQNCPQKKISSFDIFLSCLKVDIPLCHIFSKVSCLSEYSTKARSYRNSSLSPPLSFFLSLGRFKYTRDKFSNSVLEVPCVQNVTRLTQNVNYSFANPARRLRRSLHPLKIVESRRLLFFAWVRSQLRGDRKREREREKAYT